MTTLALALADVRCACGRLLLRADFKGTIHVKCQKCGKLNVVRT